MSMQYIDALRNALCNAIRDRIDSGAGAGVLAIYSGTKPATVATALSGNTLLAQVTMSDPSAPDASGGVLTLSAITEDGSADATGTASWFRIYSSADGATISEANAVAQGTVTATGGGGDLELNTTSIAAGGPVQITSFTLTAPGA